MAVDCLPGNFSSSHSSKITNKLRNRYPPLSTQVMIGSMETTNHHRTWAIKPRLVSEKRDIRRCWEDDDPDALERPVVEKTTTS
ncbi:hypothetical protein TNCV_3169391 [Trichonephila clavipes]|nr:hypothetical protein TNCV_3169391 [Trichonephila clavipes]